MRTGRIESHRELSQGLRPRGGGEACQPWPVEGVEKVAAVPAGAGFDGGLHGGMSGAVAAVRRMAGLNSGLGTGLGGGLHRWATPEGARDEWSGVYAQRTRIPSAGPGGGRCPPVAVSR